LYIFKVAAAQRLIDKESEGSISKIYTKKYTEEDFNDLKKVLLDFGETIYDISSLGNHPGNFLLDLLCKANITQSSCSHIIDMLQNLAKFLDLRERAVRGQAASLKKIIHIIDLVYSQETTDNSCYKVLFRVP
jgi:hypothetical protein